MAGAFADRVKETSTTTGTGDFTLDGPVTGFITFNNAFSTNRSFQYCIEDVDGDGVPNGDWEVGVGYLSGATTLVRDRVIINADQNDSLFNFAAGTKNVFCTFSGLAARKSTHGFDLQYGMP